ncbi:MAG: hypothetical protein HEP80_00495 [Dolichospermum sp. UKL201]|jgi:hypothetical protein|nr:MAG: hypothetical protein HEP80_00495 [Dolichospermum sp. UKL201]
MESPQDKATTIINPTIVKIIVVGVLVIILIAVVLTAFLNAPITVAVGAGIAIWWIVNALLH